MTEPRDKNENCLRNARRTGKLEPHKETDGRCFHCGKDLK